ncbi:MAG: membrane protein of unknown function [Promethearchaeota archaeon]|nr:MAG: membrane protein of unknown function [Candidatus Lokiarchaeota archaeon]
MIESFKKSKSNIYKAVLVGILVIISFLLTFYFNIFFNTNIIFSHFFYLPISLSIFWWKKRGFIIVIILSAFLIFFPFLGDNMQIESVLDNIVRVIFILSVGIILTILTEKLAESEDKLRERVKELNCLYEISNVLSKPISTVGDIIYGVLDSLKSGFQYPDDIVSQIIFQGRDYCSKNFIKTDWKITCQDRIYNKDLRVNIHYLKPHEFLDEEKQLLRDIVQQIIAIFEFKLEYL